MTADLLTEVCSDVHIEPDLQPVEGELLTGLSANVQDGARLDIAANGFWVVSRGLTSFAIRRNSSGPARLGFWGGRFE